MQRMTPQATMFGVEWRNDNDSKHRLTYNFSISETTEWQWFKTSMDIKLQYQWNDEMTMIQNIYGHIALYLYVQKQFFQFQLMVTIMINFFHMLQHMLHVKGNSSY